MYVNLFINQPCIFLIEYWSGIEESAHGRPWCRWAWRVQTDCICWRSLTVNTWKRVEGVGGKHQWTRHELCLSSFHSFLKEWQNTERSSDITHIFILNVCDWLVHLHRKHVCFRTLILMVFISQMRVTRGKICKKKIIIVKVIKP